MRYKILLLSLVIAGLVIGVLTDQKHHYGVAILLLFATLLEDPAGRFVLGFVAAGVVVFCAFLLWAYGYWRNRQRQAVIIELLNWIIANMK
jgi:hypothetical protein